MANADLIYATTSKTFDGDAGFRTKIEVVYGAKRAASNGSDGMTVPNVWAQIFVMPPEGPLDGFIEKFQLKKQFDERVARDGAAKTEQALRSQGVQIDIYNLAANHSKVMGELSARNIADHLSQYTDDTKKIAEEMSRYVDENVTVQKLDEAKAAYGRSGGRPMGGAAAGM